VIVVVYVNVDSTVGVIAREPAITPTVVFTFTCTSTITAAITSTSTSTITSTEKSYVAVFSRNVTPSSSRLSHAFIHGVDR
jgi:hypothetical protein